MHLQLNEPEVRQAVAEYIEKHHGIKVDTAKLEPLMKTYGEFDDTEKVMEGYTIEVPQGATILKHALAGVNCNATIKDGILTLEDGTEIEL